MMDAHDDAAVIRARTESTSGAAGSSSQTALEPYDNAALQIFVTDPEKHGSGMDAYVSFCVTTKTTMQEFQAQEFFVRRRYTDFVWLRSKLFSEFSTSVIPQLPSKDVAKHLNRFSPEFLEKRRYFLERFLRRCASHAKLSTSKDLHTFLEAKKWALDTAKKEKGEFLSSVKDSIDKRVASYKLKNPDERFANLRSHANSLGEHLTSLEKIGTKVQKHASDIADDLQEMGPVFTMLANSESELRDVFTQAGQAFDKLATIGHETAEKLDALYNNPVHEYVLYAAASADLLDKRDVVEYQCENAQNTLMKHENERNSLESSDGKAGLGSFFSSKNPELLKQEKLDKLATAIAEDEQTLREKQQEKKETDELVLQEFDSWHSRKVKDFKKILTDLANAQIAHHSQNLKIYESLLPHFEKIDA
ncbi:hypothetical protein CAOG_07043 [Capsaspora owczarzaki ATCC 30864]|uniref:PX domain-containing protein n=1 Tax=Capsaspora owczarzaki (strain ATCC 30864) TaxID=595528 RepID=A0A0D2WVB4_CAPO3|nr:hypothetical protein CAOG_07043 [Capsaspora owczarzaki ATCC 30864]KJE96770.1 hypothetical protein CAOG_007043 [Capsaspora owczarzaki ATCC 30864]KJE96771.1 hypothetical protein, variant [Capsaspora owczarzaki ATCC 30864]|eukprot:XP_004343767.2 hypothetical protein CAOG_07043 [Capsaspora owczarzaki ATCC 30864]